MYEKCKFQKLKGGAPPLFFILKIIVMKKNESVQELKQELKRITTNDIEEIKKNANRIFESIICNHLFKEEDFYKYYAIALKVSIYQYKKWESKEIEDFIFFAFHSEGGVITPTKI